MLKLKKWNRNSWKLKKKPKRRRRKPKRRSRRKKRRNLLPKWKKAKEPCRPRPKAKLKATRKKPLPRPSNSLPKNLNPVASAPAWGSNNGGGNALRALRD